jgi:hypothetical protein
LRQLILCAGLLAVPSVSDYAQRADISRYANDPRLTRLQEFMDTVDSPITHLAEDFLLAADRYQLDWRLLPSISLVETGCGKTATRNNIFGWNEGKRRFATVREGIHEVASRLAESKLYRGKDLNHILATYNRHPGYGRLVKSVMRRLGPLDPPTPQPAAEASLSPSPSLPDRVRPIPPQ